ncbi:MAG: cytochrome bc complex cytochrome b subunit [Planctomycetes bacterium]|nr:cytochrome bc complex cytochrome b subunit [Planctomycetota bacterium]
MEPRSSSPGPEPDRGSSWGARLGLDLFKSLAEHKTVPRHQHTIWYYMGGMALFLFMVQVATGILLLLYYRPSSTEAYESVQFIMTKVSWGWLVRSLHSISANLLVLVLLVHLGSVYFLRAYRKPREFTWVSGIALFFLFLGFGFSGYLLPWNELAYFATAVGTDIPGAMPGMGEFVVRLLRGGPDVTGATLSRFYGLHVAILPALTTVVMGLHLYQVQLHGMSTPKRARIKGPPMPFVPHFLLRDLVGWFAILGLLITIIVLAPTAPKGALFPFDFLFDPKHLLELGNKADPFSSAAAGIKPEWYFLFMYQALKMIPATVLGLEGEMLGVLAFGVGGLVLVLVPFLDRGASGLPPHPLARAAGSAIIAVGLALAALGTFCMVEMGSTLGIVGGVIAGLWIVVSVVLDRRRRGAESLLFPSLGLLTVLFIVAMTIVGRLS